MIVMVRIEVYHDDGDVDGEISWWLGGIGAAASAAAANAAATRALIPPPCSC